LPRLGLKPGGLIGHIVSHEMLCLQDQEDSGYLLHGCEGVTTGRR